MATMPILPLSRTYSAAEGSPWLNRGSPWKGNEIPVLGYHIQFVFPQF
jgi:hypothetical protein